MKKKILIFSGDHPRHLYVNSLIIKKNFNCAAVVMKKGKLLPVTPKFLNNLDKKNYAKHFKTRKNQELKAFGNLKADTIFKDIPKIKCTNNNLNSKKIMKFVEKFSPDMTFVFGTNLIQKRLMNIMPRYTINLHLGLSPYYRGSAGLFWPFYFLLPQYAGVTFQKINEHIDEGPILHQSVPKLKFGDQIHEVAVKAVIKAREDLNKILNRFEKNKKFKFYKPKHTGRVFFSNTFKPFHLRVIYNLSKENIVDQYLKGNLEKKKPKLIKAF